jgi:uncharacterized protein (DUF488 family)
MYSAGERSIWSVGHSNRSIEHFIEMLRSFNIKVLADIRSNPGSRWCPHFSRSALSSSLSLSGIRYIHFPDLGGKRNGPYIDYVHTDEFRQAIQQLELVAVTTPSAYMCAEASWRNCHRSHVSEYLMNKGWNVVHIADIGKSEGHASMNEPQPIQGSLFRS